MCFSAAASFTAAAARGALGGIGLARNGRRRGLAITAIPVLLAVQQGIEGLIWLQMEHGPPSPPLVLSYLAFAHVLWPVYAPAAAWAAETDPRRRSLAAICTLLGGLVAVYLLWGLLAFAQTATAAAGHIHYHSGQAVPLWLVGPYAIAICVPLLAASDRRVRIFGLIVTLGGVFSALAYAYGFQSVWCFFAALASLALCRKAEVSAAKPTLPWARA